MAKSTLSADRRKATPGKPYPDFPLGPHPTGRWCKRVKGVLHYFGKISGDEHGDAALAEWLRVKDELLAGRKPRQNRDGLPLHEAVNRFLSVKASDVKSGELAQRSWNDYKLTGVHMLECFGRSRVVEDLRPEDFEALKASLSKGRNLTTLGNEIQRVRCLFKYLWDADLIASPVKFGPSFKRPDKKSRRRLRNTRQPLAFTAGEVRQMLDAATPNLKAMMLLAMNCGMGNTDLAALPVHKIDLDRGWHTFGRPKTGVERRAPLWPETIAALREVLAARPKARNEADADLAFLTRHGRPYVRLQAKGDAPEGDKTTWNDAISRETGKLLRQLGIRRERLNFYSLRRTFRTVADAAGDQVATMFLMGHADSDSDISATYRQYIDDERLEKVVRHVHGWLFGGVASDGAEASGVAPVADEGEQRLQRAIAAAQRAIRDTTGPTRRTLETAWLREIENATAGDDGATRRLIETWGEDQQEAGDDCQPNDRPRLRVVNG